MFTILLTQYLDQIDPATLETETNRALKATKHLFPHLSAALYARRALQVERTLKESGLRDLVSEDFLLSAAAELGQKADQKAKLILNKGPRFVQDCCGWSDHPKQLIALKPSQIALSTTATQKLHLSEAQEFNLLACFGISNLSNKFRQIDAQFVVEQTPESEFESNLSITFIQIKPDEKSIAIPRLSKPRVCLGATINLEHQWLVLHSYEYKAQSQQITVEQMKAMHQPLEKILSDAQDYYRTQPIIKPEKENPETLESLFDETQEPDDLNDLADDSDTSFLDEDDQNSSN
ncbi:hypothetical protein ACQ4M3_07290 [Leptolyngbya sp. AN03gr2]|uniref:hypothetical protein n=1 Tax=unclassified Leptolyngbya TaxID=2650499 RepID=UPI003D31AD64